MHPKAQRFSYKNIHSSVIYDNMENYLHIIYTYVNMSASKHIFYMEAGTHM